MSTYNGWTNYATWRVNLEMIDDYVMAQASEPGRTMFATVGDLADHLRDYAEEALTIDGTRDDSLAMSYALAFLSNVDWYKIAEHAADDLVGIACMACGATIREDDANADLEIELCGVCAAEEEETA